MQRVRVNDEEGKPLGEVKFSGRGKYMLLFVGNMAGGGCGLNLDEGELVAVIEAATTALAELQLSTAIVAHNRRDSSG